MRRARVLAVALAAAGPGAASGQGLVSDRPDFTESAVTVPAGKRQLEGGYTFTRLGTADTHALGELLLRIGVSDRVELRAAPNSYTWSRTEAGNDGELEDVGVGFKLALGAAESGSSPLGGATALLVSTSIPLDRRGSLEPEARLALAWELSYGLALSSNLNVSRPRDERGGYWEPSASASLGVPLAAAVGAYLEVYGFAPAHRSGSGYVNAGLTWALRPELQLDLRAGRGVSGSDERFFGIGIARRW